MLSKALKRVLPLALPAFRSMLHPLNQDIYKRSEDNKVNTLSVHSVTSFTSILKLLF